MNTPIDMDLGELRKNWNKFGKRDPLWSIFTNPDKKCNKWDKKEFFETGKYEIDEIISYINSEGCTWSGKKTALQDGSTFEER